MWFLILIRLIDQVSDGVYQTLYATATEFMTYYKIEEYKLKRFSFEFYDVSTEEQSSVEFWKHADKIDYVVWFIVKYVGYTVMAIITEVNIHKEIYMTIFCFWILVQMFLSKAVDRRIKTATTDSDINQVGTSELNPKQISAEQKSSFISEFKEYLGKELLMVLSLIVKKEPISETPQLFSSYRTDFLPEYANHIKKTNPFRNLETALSKIKQANTVEKSLRATVGELRAKLKLHDDKQDEIKSLKSELAKNQEMLTKKTEKEISI